MEIISALFHLFSAKKFNSYLWKTQPAGRGNYIRELLETDLIRGKEAEEVELMLGRNESCSRMANRWTYVLNLNSTSHKKYYLAVYFENGIAVKVRKEYKTIQ